MNNLKDLVRCKWFFGGLLLLIITGTLLLAVIGKSASFISLNSYHPGWLNVFFINYTAAGDGIFAVCLIILVLFFFRQKQKGYALLLSFIISGLAVQLIKNLVNAPRPRLFFEPGQYLHFIDGVSLANYSSFPSGHTATAFAIATVMVMLMKNSKLQVALLMGAALVGYSCIYLAQHFLIDVLAGAFIGALSGVAAVYLAANFRVINAGFVRNRKLQTGETLTGPSANIQTA